MALNLLRPKRRREQTFRTVQEAARQEQSLFEFLKDRPSESELFLIGPSSGLRPQPRRRFARDKFGLALSCIAGFVDAAGFLTLFGLFPAHITGELISVMGILAPNAGGGVWERVGLLLVFLGAVVISAIVARRARRWSHLGRPQLAPMFTLLTAALLMFSGFGMAFEWRGSHEASWLAFLTSASAVAAMGVQNALMRVGLNTCLPTTVMTGNITQATIEIVELVALRLSPSDRGKPRISEHSRLLRVLASIAGFSLGAALAVVLTTYLGLGSVLLPTCIAGTLAVVAWRERLQA
jgi:uncharacterized membrane protein YoaK (UPF0700 family)